MYLLDTNVVSALRFAKHKAPQYADRVAVAKRLGKLDTSSFYLSVISLTELERGVLLKKLTDVRQAEAIEQWLRNKLLPSFQDRILSIDRAVAARCAALHVPNQRPAFDSLIAATALVHNMTVVTRNTADFAGMGIKLLNPWEASA